MPEADYSKNNEPSYLRPILRLFVDRNGEPDLGMLEACASSPTLSITYDHYQFLVDNKVRSISKIWQGAVNAYNQECLDMNEELMPEEIIELTGTNQIDRLAKDFEFRILVMSPTNPQRNYWPSSNTNGMDEGFPFIKCLSSNGQNHILNADNFLGMTNIILADLEQIYTGYASQLTIDRYRDLGYSPESLREYTEKIIKAGILEEPQSPRLNLQEDTDDLLKSKRLQAVFQMLFMKDDLTGEPIDIEMNQHVQRIVAGDFKFLQNIEDQNLLKLRLQFYGGYVEEIPNINNPDRLCLTERELRLFLIELGLVNADPKMQRSEAAVLKSLLRQAQCLIPKSMVKGPDLYLSASPLYSEILSSDGTVIPSESQPLQKYYCDPLPCPLVSICQRGETLSKRKPLPSLLERMAVRDPLAKYLNVAVRNYCKHPFKSIITLPNIARSIEITGPLSKRTHHSKDLGIKVLNVLGLGRKGN